MKFAALLGVQIASESLLVVLALGLLGTSGLITLRIEQFQFVVELSKGSLFERTEVTALFFFFIAIAIYWLARDSMHKISTRGLSE